MKTTLNIIISVMVTIFILSFQNVIAEDIVSKDDDKQSLKSAEEIKKEEELEKEKKRLEYVKYYEPSGTGKIEKVNDYIFKFIMTV